MALQPLFQHTGGDLAIPRAINRARLLSWAPRRAGGVRESKANSQGGEGLSLPKERSGNNLSGSRNRALPSPHLSLPVSTSSQEGTMDNEQQCPQGHVPFLLPVEPWGLLLFRSSRKGTGKGLAWDGPWWLLLFQPGL